MTKQEKINKQVEEALHSINDIKQAIPTYSAWDNILAFISKPLVAVACIALIVAINAWVLSDTNAININTEDSYAIADEYNTNAVTINEFENIEP
jgi:hypothetical protein